MAKNSSICKNTSFEVLKETDEMNKKCEVFAVKKIFKLEPVVNFINTASAFIKIEKFKEKEEFFFFC